MPPRKHTGKKKNSSTLIEKQEEERAAAIEAASKELAETESEIEELQAQCEDLLIPLINVEITSLEHGTGIVIEQDENNLVIQYPDAKIVMIMGNLPKTRLRPVFDNDTEVWHTFAQYASIKARITSLSMKRDTLQKKIDSLEAQ